MSCYINQNIETCFYILNEVKKFYIAEFSSLFDINYILDDDEIIDIFPYFNWVELKFTQISIQTDYLLENNLYSTSVRIGTDNITNETQLFLNQRKKFLILFIDKNNNAWIDGVLKHDNQYKLSNISYDINNDTNQLNFDLIKTSPYELTKISNNYIKHYNL